MCKSSLEPRLEKLLVILTTFSASGKSSFTFIFPLKVLIFPKESTYKLIWKIADIQFKPQKTRVQKKQNGTVNNISCKKIEI